MGKATRKEILFWTQDEYRRFSEQTMEKPQYFYAFEVLYWCGIREGELLALTPADFDFERQMLSITKSYQRINGRDVITDPKTPKSVRKIKMPDFLVEEIQDYLKLLYDLQPTDRMDDSKRLANKLTNPSTWDKGGERLKFDAIVGNPPYQKETNLESRQAVPVYNAFVEQAKALNPTYISMIMPSRWFAGGMGLDSFRANMMTDRSISMLTDYVNAKDCFPEISISGGVCYFLRDSKYQGNCRFTNVLNGQSTTSIRSLSEFPILVRYNGAVDVLRKVLAFQEQTLSNIISSISPYGLSTKIRGVETRSESAPIKLYASGGTSYIRLEDIVKGTETLPYYKVLISQTSAEHAGEPSKEGNYRVLTSTMTVMNPNEVCTHSYITAGSFDSEKQAVNLLGYLKTKFVRFLLLQALSSIHLTKSTFIFVPMQDFSKSWTDEDLYRKYGLTSTEIALIEAMIKPM